MKKIMKKIIIIGLLGWGVFQLAVTPWTKDLPGKLMFNTTRIRHEGPKGYGVTAMYRQGKTEVIFKNDGPYSIHWHKDGKRVAGLYGPKVGLFNEQGEILKLIPIPEGWSGTDLDWLPDSERVLVIERPRVADDKIGTVPTRMVLYDFVTGVRTLVPVQKDMYGMIKLTISDKGQVVFQGSAVPFKPATLNLLDIKTGEVKVLKKGNNYKDVAFIDDHRVAFNSSWRLFNQVLSPDMVGVYNLKTGMTRYLSLFAGDIRNLTVGGQYIITSEGEGDGQVLYKRSVWGGFKRPVLSPTKERVKWLRGMWSQDSFPAWHE